MKQPEQLEQKLQQALRKSEQNLPDNLQSRLANIRQTALSEPAAPNPMFTWPGFAVGMATVVVVAMLFAPMFNSNNSSTFDNSTALALVEEDIEKDLEFYQWLLETDAIEGLSE
ncbi:MAG: hypothetical protein OIF34_00750 [Porticoccaceae bacterium]|nr:hypothetical protein [Porticoccaceae bacterium]